MKKILLFAGTYEGRQLASQLDALELSLTVSVATAYGGDLLSLANSRVMVNRLEELEMELLLQEYGFDLVIDATHAYAAVVTQNIQAACAAQGIPYLRLLRAQVPYSEEQCVCVSSAAEAAQYLSSTEGNILLTTGSKELMAFTQIPQYQERVFARVLPMASVMEQCISMGFSGRHLIGMQGPFSKELNIALLHYAEASYLVTKESGDIGGFPEKLEAAAQEGVQTVVITKPLEETGLPYEEVLRIASEGCPPRREQNGSLPEKERRSPCRHRP